MYIYTHKAKTKQMITNFEEITEDLTEVELKRLTQIKELMLGFLGSNRNNAVTQKELVSNINNTFEYMTGQKNFMTPVRLRKYINYFRTKGIMPIIATSEGCFTTEDKEEIKKQVLSLEQRARSIQKAAEGLKKFL